PEYSIAADLAAGTLVRVLPQHTTRRPVMALYARSPPNPRPPPVTTATLRSALSFISTVPNIRA
ncbi:MAG: hypothetical protein WAL15_14880, partial [Xanthobacteraceae bacterium]